MSEEGKTIQWSKRALEVLQHAERRIVEVEQTHGTAKANVMRESLLRALLHVNIAGFGPRADVYPDGAPKGLSLAVFERDQIGNTLLEYHVIFFRDRSDETGLLGEWSCHS